MLENKYTPIKDKATKKPLSLGDLVKNERGQCGILSWCDLFNTYLIRTPEGGNIYAKHYTKISELKDNNIDTTYTECRRNPNKIKW